MRTNNFTYKDLKKQLLNPRLGKEEKEEIEERINKVKYKEYFDKFTLNERQKLENNLNIIIDLIQNFGARKSPRDIDYPFPNTDETAGDKIFLQQIVGSSEDAEKIKIYTREQEENILKSFDSITSYELYILGKIAGFKKTKTVEKTKSQILTMTEFLRNFLNFHLMI